MNTLKGFLYTSFIDPLLAGLKNEIIRMAGNPEKVIDIACGTGALAVSMSEVAGTVVGIDLDEEFVSYASLRNKKYGIRNVLFEVRDASNLSSYGDKEFDIAVTTMSVHQFEHHLAVKILSEMRRIASVVIIGDYNFPLPKSLSGAVASGIERMAGGDHYKNFRNYISLGGIKHFTDSAGLTVIASSLKGSGTFIVVRCE